MKNITRIDLKDLSFEQLKNVCEKYGFSYEKLSNDKKKGILSIWFDADNRNIIAQENSDFFNKSTKFVYNTGDFDNFLLSIKSISAKKVIYDADVILEKINKYGIGSLDNSELDFLKSR